MTNNSLPRWEKISASISNAIVILWPEETKDWAHAFAAELQEIETPFAAFHWLLGGLMLLTRERFKHFLGSFGRPFGSPLGNDVALLTRNSTRMPRTPRIITLLLLVASFAVLFTTELRTSFRSIVRAYVNKNEETSRWGSVQELRKEADRNHDPKLLALLSLLSANETESFRLADEAISMDPSFTWLDYEHAGWRFNDSHFSYERQIGRLQKWDPENAVVHLLAAHSIFDADIRRGRLEEYLQLRKEAPVSERAKLWTASMERAFHSPKYDSYADRPMELIREISKNHPKLDPDIVGYILPRTHIPNLMEIRTYAEILVHQGSSAEAGGDMATANEKYWQVLHFALIMRQGGQSTIETLIAGAVGKQACDKLQPLLEKTRHSNEATLVGFQSSEWKNARGARWRNRWTSTEWSALTIQLTAMLILLFAASASLSVLILLATRKASLEKRSPIFAFLSWAVDACPLLLLLSSMALFAVCHPFAQAYRSFLSSSRPDFDFDLITEATLVTHFAFPESFFSSGQSVFQFWVAVTSILVLLATFLLFRLLRPSRSTIAQ